MNNKIKLIDNLLLRLNSYVIPWSRFIFWIDSHGLSAIIGDFLSNVFVLAINKPNARNYQAAIHVCSLPACASGQGIFQNQTQVNRTFKCIAMHENFELKIEKNVILSALTKRFQIYEIVYTRYLIIKMFKV